MIITCSTRNKIGYIHLQPYNIKHKSIYDSYKTKLDNNDLRKYVDLNSLKIPIYDSFDYGIILDHMKISKKIYKIASENSGDFIEEYQNDLNDNGYMVGIELDLSKESFLSLIKHDIKIFKHKWLNKDFILLTLDNIENVLHLDNVIYPFTDREDAFAIVHIENKYRTGLIKGIISAREDLYPIEYLSKPEFILWDE